MIGNLRVAHHSDGGGTTETNMPKPIICRRLKDALIYVLETEVKDKDCMTRPKDDARREDDKARVAVDSPAPGRVFYGDQSGHLAFQQQLTQMLARADITEEQRQQILIAATCPCCGAGGLSLSLNIKPDGTPQF
jgi:hypothetical protein